MMLNAIRSRLDYALFGVARPQRVVLQRTALAGGIAFVLLGLHVFEVRAGLMDATQAWYLTYFCLFGTFGFYAVIRSGFNLRLGSRSSLTLPQQIFAIVTIVWTYAIAGADRGAVIALLVLILMFGVFAFRTRVMTCLAVLTLLLLAAVMLLQYCFAPSAARLKISLFELCYATLAVLPVCVLAAQINRLQSALHAKRKALEQAVDQIRRLAESDDLTSLLNRRAMLQVMQSEMHLRQPTPNQICLALVDIDLFKSVNDRFGHQAGDEVLRLFAVVGKSTLRTSDMFSRWGGEEFLLLLPDTSVAQGVQCMERLRAALAAAPFGGIAAGLEVTISVGVTDLHPNDRLEAAIDRADQAMYRAKQSGRNQVMIGAMHADIAGIEEAGAAPPQAGGLRATA